MFGLTRIALGQHNVKISISPLISIHTIELNENLNTPNKQQLTITNLKFYISNFSLYKNGLLQYTWKKKHHLIDINNPLTTIWQLDSIEGDFDEIKFQLGIDSLTNVSGALAGDLDPTKGMYWTWQSGYINFKIEGNYLDSNQVNDVFEYHLGGYLPPFQTVQNISIPCNSRNEIKIAFDLDLFFRSSETVKLTRVMSPGADAQALSELLVKCFQLYEK